STASSTSAAVIASLVTRRVTASPLALREGLVPSERGAVMDAPAGRADKAAGSFLPGFAIDVFPSSSAVAIAMRKCGQSAANGTLIRMAAKAEAEARKSLPKELTRVAPAPAISEGLTAKPNENTSAVLTDPGADSTTGAAALGLAEQAAGQSDAVIGTADEPH